MGIIGNQERRILKAASKSPDTKPKEVVLIPPDADTLDNPPITFDASDRRKT
jgi:hypothetical protein